ncbi:hypothetical protein [Dictyobacter kobayashii]|uniref:Uncharacterized protein n=1 Tax=Dictyobacter kobayashii TaxID=2014872 RepID=A0A402ANF2_9CHLR|nr:hypothetical protein [Dictyobacter kobayashii]GCE20549.1 hypothetical protein KDK_43490 [Dictyobacter kobayashii]
MHLHDNLQICLYALDNRYPNHIVDINKGIIASKEIPLTGWRALELVELLLLTAPQLLQAEAIMVIDYDECSIYLPAISEIVPLCTIHCHGKIPPHVADGVRWLKHKPIQPEEPITASDGPPICQL